MNTLPQSQIFILFLIIGIFIGILFDFFRAIRKTFKISDFITYIQDIVFMAIVGIIIVNNLLILNNGNLRFFIIVAIIFGITIYYLSISKLFFTIFKIFMKFIKKIIFLPYNIIKNGQNFQKKWYILK